MLYVSDPFRVRRVAINKHLFARRKAHLPIVATPDQYAAQVRQLPFEIRLTFLEIVACRAVLCFCDRAVTPAVHTRIIRRKQKHRRPIPTRIFFGIVPHVVILLARRRFQTVQKRGIFAASFDEFANKRVNIVSEAVFALDFVDYVKPAHERLDVLLYAVLVYVSLQDRHDVRRHFRFTPDVFHALFCLPFLFALPFLRICKHP